MNRKQTYYKGKKHNWSLVLTWHFPTIEQHEVFREGLIERDQQNQGMHHRHLVDESSWQAFKKFRTLHWYMNQWPIILKKPKAQIRFQFEKIVSKGHLILESYNFRSGQNIWKACNSLKIQTTIKITWRFFIRQRIW